MKLAVPVMFSRAGLLIMIAVDTAMCGHAGSEALAAYGIGSAPQIPLLLIGIGMLMGTVVLTAQADGANEPHRTGAIWKVAMVHGAGYGVLLSLFCLPGEAILLALGQSTALAASGGQVLVHFAWGLPAALLFTVCIFYLEGIQRPMPGMVIMVLANIVNAAANYVLIFGAYGWPAMGAAGAASATSFTRWFMFAALFLYILIAVDKKYYGFGRSERVLGSTGKAFRRMGYPMALGQGLESTSFAAMAVIAGWIGNLAVGVWAIVMNVIAIVFMLSLGFTTATSVRVGNAVGRRDPHNLARAGWVGVGLCGIILVSTGCMVYWLRYPIAGIYTDADPVLLAAVAALVVAAVVVIPDGLQSVLVGALRGASDFWPPAIAQFIAFWLVMVPLAYVYAYRSGGGAIALMVCVGIGALVAVSLLLMRFHWLTTQFKRRFTARHTLSPS